MARTVPQLTIKTWARHAPCLGSYDGQPILLALIVKMDRGQLCTPRRSMAVVRQKQASIHFISHVFVRPVRVRAIMPHKPLGATTAIPAPADVHEQKCTYRPEYGANNAHACPIRAVQTKGTNYYVYRYLKVSKRKRADAYQMIPRVDEKS